jgi:dihydroneopterin aldolase
MEKLIVPPGSHPKPGPGAQVEPVLVSARVFVRGLSIEAQIGVHDHEYGRAQPLIIDAELDLAMAEPERLSQTFNYETIARTAKAIAAAGHIGLVETFAWRLARTLLEDDRVDQVRVRIEKPTALAPDALAAGVEITLTRGHP